MVYKEFLRPAVGEWRLTISMKTDGSWVPSIKATGSAVASLEKRWVMWMGWSQLIRRWWGEIMGCMQLWSLSVTEAV